jgi:hypothetical protein
VVNLTPRPRFTPGKSIPIPIRQEAGWASEHVWTQRLEEKSFASVEAQSSTLYLDTILNELRLYYARYVKDK